MLPLGRSGRAQRLEVFFAVKCGQLFGLRAAGALQRGRGTLKVKGQNFEGETGVWERFSGAGVVHNTHIDVEMLVEAITEH